MRLADFILSNIEPILMEWKVFARGIGPGAKMDALALRDHAPDILLATVQDMKSSQSAAERSAKSRGHHGRRGGGTGEDRPDLIPRSRYRLHHAPAAPLSQVGAAHSG